MEKSAEGAGKMKICVVGLGYMGIPTALLLAKSGYEVVGYDVIKEKAEMLNRGQLPFDEKGLKELFKEAGKNFRAIDRLEQADAYLVAVPTPVTKEKKCDNSYVESAMKSIAPFVKPGVLIILESTVRPGTTAEVVRPILEKSGYTAGKDFSLAYVSEKAIPGNTLYEMAHNDRIIGGLDEQSRQMTAAIYRSFVKGAIHVTDCTTAETVKLMENSYRDVNIALANELAKICGQLGINAWEAISLANHHPRVHIHQPGPGVGGHCIAIDPWFLIENHEGQSIIRTAREINDAMPEYAVKLIESMLGGKTKAKIAVLGAAYKKDIDDARESPTERMAQILRGRGHDFTITDPFVRKFPEKITSFDEAVKNADAIILAVDHGAYKEKEKLLAEMEQKGAKILDARNLFNGRFATLGIGRRAAEKGNRK